MTFADEAIIFWENEVAKAQKELDNALRGLESAKASKYQPLVQYQELSNQCIINI